MSRRGLSHIEFVISFVIFIAFIVFAFVFFNPLESNRTLKSTLDYSWIEIGGSTKYIIETYSVVIDPSVTENNVAVEINGIPNTFNASVEGTSGNIINSYIDLNGAVHFPRPSDNFVRIKYSPIFPNGAVISGTLLLPDLEYTISSSEEDELYFEKLLIDLNNSYFSNYTALKKEFNLPNRVNFGFNVKFIDLDINAIKEVPEEAEVLSRNDRVVIIRKSGAKEYADLRVLVW